jgi:hypothetical protein
MEPAQELYSDRRPIDNSSTSAPAQLCDGVGLDAREHAREISCAEQLEAVAWGFRVVGRQ